MNIEDIKRARIQLAVYAYAYEVKDDPLISDAEYDKLSAKLDYTTLTGNEKLDYFFQSQYSPDTGSWVRSHPGMFDGSLERIYNLKKNPKEGV